MIEFTVPSGGFDHCIACVRLTTNCGPATIVNTRFIHLLITSDKQYILREPQLAPPSASRGQHCLFPLLHLQAFQRLLTSYARVQDSLKHPLQYSNHSYRLPLHAAQPSTARVLDTPVLVNSQPFIGPPLSQEPINPYPLNLLKEIITIWA